MLKEILNTRGLKQKWLADQLHVSEVTVSNWCKEKSKPSERNLNKICDLLNVSIDELVKKNNI